MFHVEDFKKSLLSIFEDQGHAENAKKVSKLFRYIPQRPLEVDRICNSKPNSTTIFSNKLETQLICSFNLFFLLDIEKYFCKIRKKTERKVRTDQCYAT